MTEQLELHLLCAAGRFSEAAERCHRRREQAATSAEAALWMEQLGYIYFLDEQGDEHYQAVSVFEELVAEAPDNVNAHFWLGYMSLILFVDEEVARRELNEVLRRLPDHPYANLVLAGMLEPQEALPCLERVLAIQPGNRRALSQLADVWAGLGGPHQAAEARLAVQTRTLYIESDYGLMNQYINEVFIRGASISTRTAY